MERESNDGVSRLDEGELAETKSSREKMLSSYAERKACACAIIIPHPQIAVTTK